MKRSLLAGWFSFEEMGASAGDLMVRDLAASWLCEAGHVVDIALAPPFSGGVDWTSADPDMYTHVVFVCGPLGNGPPVDEFLARFSRCQLVGLDLSMLHLVSTWNPFDLLWERDSERGHRPDVAFLSEQSKVPVVGMVLIDAQPEYGSNNKLAFAHGLIEDLMRSREAAAVRIDTRLDVNMTGLRTPAEVESLIAAMDVVVTTRLHGTVLALKNGVPPIAVDTVSGGGKITRQCDAVGWPVLSVDTLTPELLARAYDECLTAAAKRRARDCGDRARKLLAQVHADFVAALAA